MRPAPAPGPDRVVILAGGAGTRLWPWTAPHRPKPLLPLGGGGRSLLRATLERLDGLVPPEAVDLLATRDLGRALAAAEPRARDARLLDEPAPRDTGPAVALAMRRAAEERPDAVVAILPADHRIADEAAFRAALATAAEVARGGEPVLLGIRPDRPATGFGYLEVEDGAAGGVLRVRRFREKPAADAARALVASGALWNAGMFVWRADVFGALLERHAPGIAGPVAAFAASGDEADWRRAPRISIDFGLLEKLPRVAAVPLEAGWDDVGGWDAVVALAAAGDAGDAVLEVPRGDADGSLLLRVGGAPVPAVVLGGPTLVVVGPEGLLVCPRTGADGVKAYV